MGVVGQGPHKQKTLSVTQNMVELRGMVVCDGGRSTGVLLFYSTGMVKYFFDIEFYHYAIQHPILVPEV